MTAELNLPCFSCSLLVLHTPDGTFSLPSHASGGTGVPDLHTKPGQTFCCWLSRRCLAVQAHDTLPIFARAAVSQEADSCPLLSQWQHAGRGWEQKALYGSLHFVPGDPEVQLLLP